MIGLFRTLDVIIILPTVHAPEHVVVTVGWDLLAMLYLLGSCAIILGAVDLCLFVDSQEREKTALRH